MDRRFGFGHVGAWLVLVVGGILLPAGCGGKCVDLDHSTAQLDSAIATPGKPVLVDFWKAGCPACMVLDPTMDQLADQYQGRAVVARFWMVDLLYAPTNPEVYNRYGLSAFPTVILFVDGKESKRWVGVQDISVYRMAIDPLVGPSAGQRTR